jgi:hypothetical protein
MTSQDFIDENPTISRKQALSILRNHDYDAIGGDFFADNNIAPACNEIDSEQLFSWLGY